jgi:CheY-like chemotaxis protein
VNAPEALGRKVLVVDDDPGIVRALCFRLLKAGYRPLTATGGTEGLSLAREHAPDAIILDLRMPDLDGFGLLKELQSSQHTSGIPAIVLSADAGARARLAATRKGAIFFVEKPFKADELLLALTKALAATAAAEA